MKIFCLALLVFAVLLVVSGCGNNAPSPPPSADGSPEDRLRELWGPGTVPPVDAVSTVNRLVSQDGGTLRSALDPELARAVPVGAAAEQGAGIVLDPDGWRQEQDTAIATGQFTVPGQPNQRIVIGLAKSEDQWKVEFAEPLS